MRKKCRAGFTLLEMAIVLIIIGVITGGILVGKTIFTNSRLQTIMTDADSYITAVNNFKQAYQALPGDMANATSFWGTDSGCNGGTFGTCNGNGDGMIGGSSAQAYESFRFWQHLYYAGMFNQRLSGVAGSAGTYSAVVYTNSPVGSFKGSGYYVVWWGTLTTDADHFGGYYGHILQFGGGVTNGPPTGVILTPDQAASIDAKIDDASPTTGKVRTYSGSVSATINPNCATSGLPTATYNVSNTTPQCSLIFVTGF